MYTYLSTPSHTHTYIHIYMYICIYIYVNTVHVELGGTRVYTYYFSRLFTPHHGGLREKEREREIEFDYSHGSIGFSLSDLIA